MPQKLNKAGKMQNYDKATGRFASANVISKNVDVSVGKDKRYIVRDREAGNKITSFDTYEEAEKEIKKYEAQDKKDGFYEEDFYEIYDNGSNEKKETKTNVIDNDLTGKKEENEQITKLDTPQKKQTLKDALSKALDSAKKSYDNNKEDGGTSNLDECRVYLDGARLSELENIISQVSPNLKIAKRGKGEYAIYGYEKGQGNLNTRMVDAFAKVLKDNGFDAMNYYITD